MSSGNNKASTSIDKNVGIGKEEGPKKNHDTVCEENTTENGNSKLPAPFKLASEHNNIQGGMQNGVKSAQTHVKEGIYDGGKPPSAFVTPGKGNGKEIEPDINEFYDSLVDFVGREGLKETDEERNEREEKEEEEKKKNNNKKLKINDKENKKEEEKNEQNKETASATTNEGGC
jgi:predicted ribosome quality control (RQC) complex YloA/Tae2 family protein